MAYGVIVLNGQYGPYYKYTYKGKGNNLSLKEFGTTLTPEQLDKLIDDKKLSFTYNGYPVTANLEEVYNHKRHKWTQKITYSTEAPFEGEAKTEDTGISDDIKKVEDGKSELLETVTIYKENVGEFHKQIRSALNNLKLGKFYYYALQEKEVPNIYVLTIYFGKFGVDYQNTDKILTSFMVEVNDGKAKEISVSEYNEKLSDWATEKVIKEKVRKENQEKYIEVVKEGIEWLNNFKAKLFTDAALTHPLPKPEIFAKIAPYVSGLPTSDMSVLFRRPPLPVSIKLKDVEKYVYDRITLDNCTEDLAEMKRLFLQWLREFYDYYGLKYVRDKLFEEVQTKGLEEVVEPISVDTALSLGNFRTLQSAMRGRISKGTDKYRYIIYQTFKEVNDENELKTNLLNLSRCYYEFTDIPTKDHKALAKFIAVNNLDEYYAMVLELKDALKEVMQYGEPKLKKAVISDIIKKGKSFPDVDMSSSFYFERKVRIKNDYEIVDPVGVVTELRKLIPIYNESSNVTVLSNIELDADGSTLTYQFYTFSDSEKGEDFDGRRIQYMTKLYNQCHKDKVYFDYDT